MLTAQVADAKVADASTPARSNPVIEPIMLASPANPEGKNNQAKRVITIAPTPQTSGETVLSPSVARNAEPAATTAPSDNSSVASVPPATLPASPVAEQLAALAVSVEPAEQLLPSPAAPTAGTPPTLTQTAKAGDAKIQFELASRYAEGRSVRKDPTEAANWYQRAATQGLAPAQYRLGALYEKGQGVTQDKDAAQIWYQRAAEQGNVKAMHNLAVLCLPAAPAQTPTMRALLAGSSRRPNSVSPTVSTIWQCFTSSVWASSAISALPTNGLPLLRPKATRKPGSA